MMLAFIMLIFWYFSRKQETAPQQEEASFSPPVVKGPTPMEKNSVAPVSQKNVEVEVEVVINNIPFFWLTQMHAVRASDAPQGDVQNGFQFVASPLKQKFGEFSSEKLFVVIDKMHLERRIITGSIVVTLNDASHAAEVGSLANVKLMYESPAIKVAIYRVQEGQNFLEKLAQLKTLPQVKSATLELLGKGLQVK